MADSSVVTDRRLAQSFSSLWRELTPMADAYVRSVNLRRERRAVPIESSVPADRRGLVNELAFRLYKFETQCGRAAETADRERMGEEVRRFISNMPRMERDVVAIQPEEWTEADVVANRLAKLLFSMSPLCPLTFSPRFKGYGRLLPCEGDLLQGVTLWEIKAGEREFGVHDLRQVLIYCALNYSEKAYRIDQIGVMNPRTAVVFRETVEEVCVSISGRQPSELFNDIQTFLCSEGPSI